MTILAPPRWPGRSRWRTAGGLRDRPGSALGSARPPDRGSMPEVRYLVNWPSDEVNALYVEHGDPRPKQRPSDGTTADASPPEGTRDSGMSVARLPTRWWSGIAWLRGGGVPSRRHRTPARVADQLLSKVISIRLHRRQGSRRTFRTCHHAAPHRLDAGAGRTRWVGSLGKLVGDLDDVIGAARSSSLRPSSPRMTGTAIRYRRIDGALPASRLRSGTKPMALYYP